MMMLVIVAIVIFIVKNQLLLKAIREATSILIINRQRVTNRTSLSKKKLRKPYFRSRQG